MTGICWCLRLLTLPHWNRSLGAHRQPLPYAENLSSLLESLARAVTNIHIPWTIEAFFALLYLTQATFFACLPVTVYLFDINHTLFTVVICWLTLLSAGYGCIALMPIFSCLTVRTVHHCPKQLDIFTLCVCP